jgi:hypothetical protein
MIPFEFQQVGAGSFDCLCQNKRPKYISISHACGDIRVTLACHDVELVAAGVPVVMNEDQYSRIARNKLSEAVSFVPEGYKAASSAPWPDPSSGLS